MSLDLIIRGGTVIDGTGRSGVVADVGVEGDRIVAVGDLAAATAPQEHQAAGLVVCPGFIDTHTHSDLTLLVDGRAESKIRQGVTTEVTGNCSFSPYPIRPGHTEILKRFDMQEALQTIECDWTDLDGYARRLEAAGIALNVAPLVGNAALRIAVLGEDEGEATPDQIREMQRLTDQAMEQGAFGLSVGLTLVPSCYATTNELIELSRIAARYGRMYIQHSRIWAGWHETTIHEAVEIGRAAGCGVQISHQAIIDSRQFGAAPALVAIMEEARATGVDIMYDAYPYIAAGSHLDQLLPTWVQQGGVATMLARLDDPATRQRAIADTRAGWFGGLPFDWSKLFITEVGREESKRYLGWSFQQVADDWGVEGAEVAIDLIRSERNNVGIVMFNRDEDDARYFLQHPLGMIGSDGSSVAPTGPFADTQPHPRFYGTYPRILGHYVREEPVFTLETAIYKMTGLPAERFGLRDRGVIAPGKSADLVVFDPANVADQATFAAPHRYPLGIRDVFVAGQAVLAGGERSDHLPGKVLRAG
jgi:N-acyl-D-amino-acid deacylase